MAFSSKFSRYHIKSISLPCRSHPSTIKIEQELNKLKTWEVLYSSTQKSICDGLSGLTMLYKCMDELLNLSLIQQALSHHQCGKWVNEVLDGSVQFLDICSLTRDMMSQIIERVRDLQSALRRRKGDSNIEEAVDNYISLRKKIKKDSKKLVADLKQVNHTINTRPPVVDLDHLVIAIIRVLVEVSEMTSSIFESMLLFFSSSISIPKPNPKQSKWLLVSKLILKRTNASEDHELRVPMNEMKSVDATSLLNLCKNGSSDEAQKSLEKIEVEIESLDKELECIFRCLIRTRASLLNILSQ